MQGGGLMGVLQVPSSRVFSEVVRLSNRMNKEICGIKTAGAELLSSWIQELRGIIPTAEMGHLYFRPSEEWDDQDRYAVMHRILYEMRREGNSVPAPLVRDWTFRLDAVSTENKVRLEEIRQKLINETIH